MSAIVSGILNGVAFSGGNWLFKMFEGKDKDKDKAEEERKRHNLAEEKLNKANSAWNQKRQIMQDYKYETLKKQQQSESDFEDADHAMRVYHQLLEAKPKLSNFYTPSPKQQHYETIFIVGAVLVSSYVMYKYL